MQEAAPAKINLYLHVLGRRTDGYHLLDSLVVFTDIGDRLEAVTAEGLSLTIKGLCGGNLSSTDNSILKAACRLQPFAAPRLGAAITLDKQLPVASGIGGGSSDAAAALRLLARLWDIPISPEALRRLASALGADMSACLHASTLHMSGIGEIIKPAPPLPSFHMVLANPGQALSTQLVFSRYKASFSAPPRLPGHFDSLKAFVAFLNVTHNDLQAPAIACLPQIAEVLTQLRQQEDCLLARMSGSGATCFGIFETYATAQNAALRLKALRPDWWVAPARII